MGHPVDASEIGISGVLTETDENGTKPVANASSKLIPAEQNYHISEREPLAIKHALQE